MITNFIWNGKKAKIPLKQLQLNKECGGLKLVSIEKRDIAIKICWINILYENEDCAIMAYKCMENSLNHQIWECNLRKDHVENFIKHPFWKDVMEAWSEINYDPHPTVWNQIIWMNSLIMVNLCPIRLEKCIKKKLIYVEQLFNNGKPISFMKAKRDFDLDIMEYNGIISALPKEWRNNLKTANSVSTESLFGKYKSIKKPSQLVYRELCMDEKQLLSKKIQRWEFELKVEISYEQFMCFYKEIFKVTNVPKLRSFQYRLLHRAIITNVHLFRWQLRNNNLCSFCNKDKESYAHLFVMCECVQNIWVKLEQYMHSDLTTEKINFNCNAVIFNKLIEGKAGNVKNFLCLVTKQYIYAQRCLGKMPNYNELIAKIRQIKNMERYIAIKNNKLRKHQQKWDER